MNFRPSFRPRVTLRVTSWLTSLLMLCMVALPARASVLLIDGAVSGRQGDSISVSLTDADLVNFEAADIQLTYDPMVLTLSNVLSGSMTSGFFINFSQPPMARADGLVDVFISLITGGAPISGSGSILELLLDIDDQAISGSTLAVSLPDFADPAGYRFEPLSAPVAVLPSVSLSTVNSLALVLLGLTGMAVLRRRPAFTG